MSNEEFETYLALVSRLLRLSPSQREQIGEELRDHLESRVSELVEAGVKRQAAVLQAVEEFGDATVLAQSLKAVSLANRKRWMMRFMTMCTAALFFLGVFTMAMWPEGARFGTPSDTVAQSDDPFAGGDDDPFNGVPAATSGQVQESIQLSRSTQEKNAIRDLLKQPGDLIFDESPFSDVAGWLQEQLNTNIVIDPSAYEDALQEDTMITSSLKQIRLSDGLRIMLRPHNATYVIDTGVIRIISLDDEPSAGYFNRRMIKVGPLLEKIAVKDVRVGTPRYSFMSGGGGFSGGGGGGNAGGGGGGGGGGVFSQASQVASDQSNQNQPVNEESEGGHHDVESNGPRAVVLVTAESLLIQAIQETVEAEAWIDMGMGESAITCVGGVLIVHAHESLISQVEDFVVDLEYELTQN